MTLPGSAASLPPVQLEEFDGPLDLLLDEVRRQNVAIENISMAPVAARFLEYVRTAAARNLNLDIEWLHMAATLIEWKSRSLLPAGASAAAPADPIRDDLVRQLTACRGLAGAELGRRGAIEETRVSAAREGEPGQEADPPAATVWDMIQQARELARWVRQHREDRHQWIETFGVEQDEVTVAEMMEHLRAQLAAAVGVPLDGILLLEAQPTALRRSCLFLGMLELARARELHIGQAESFGPIRLTGSLP